MPKLGNPFFQLPEPQQVPLAEVPVGHWFQFQGKTYVKTPGGVKPQRGRTPKVPPPPETLVEI